MGKPLNAVQIPELVKLNCNS